MVRLLIYCGWLVTCIALGIVESAVSIPLFALGLLFFFVSAQSWWLRLIALTVAGVVWAISMAVSPVLVVGVVYLGTWFQMGLRSKISQRSGLFWSALMTALAIGVLRGLTLSFSFLLLVILEIWFFWLCTRWLTSNTAPLRLFFIPPQSTTDAKKNF